MNRSITTLGLGSVLAALSLTTVLPAHAADAVRVSLLPERPALGEPFRIEVRGEWAAACAPDVGDSWVDGEEIVLQLRESKRGCADQPRFALQLNSDAKGAAALTAHRSGVYRLRVLAGSAERTLAFALAEIGDAKAAPRPESGLWWPEPGGEFETSGPGLGAQIELQGATLALNVSGYDDGGSPFWWFGASELSNRLQTLELTALRGGSGPFASYSAPKQAEAGGSVHIEWIDASRATFWFARGDAESGLEIQPISMTRFAFGTRAGVSWQGEWVLVQRGTATRSSLISFDLLNEADDGFALSGDAGDVLSCRRDPRRSETPPSECRLLRADAAAVQFRSIGLNRLEGIDENGETISLIRLDPAG